MRIDRHGDIRKLVERVAQITFSGTEAVRTRQQVLYVTERAVFRLEPHGLVLEEVAPGVAIKTDVLDRMGFAPLVPSPPKTMDPDIFHDRKGGCA